VRAEGMRAVNSPVHRPLQRTTKPRGCSSQAEVLATNECSFGTAVASETEEDAIVRSWALSHTAAQMVGPLKSDGGGRERGNGVQ
jgi:hypothetical protein